MFAQVCRHKAAPVAEGSGCVKMFECMYHGWQYGEQGKPRIEIEIFPFHSGSTATPGHSWLEISPISVGFLCTEHDWLWVGAGQITRGGSGGRPN